LYKVVEEPEKIEKKGVVQIFTFLDLKKKSNNFVNDLLHKKYSGEELYFINDLHNR
jgi:hypothetical protein